MKKILVDALECDIELKKHDLAPLYLPVIPWNRYGSHSSYPPTVIHELNGSRPVDAKGHGLDGNALLPDTPYVRARLQRIGQIQAESETIIAELEGFQFESQHPRGNSVDAWIAARDALKAAYAEKRALADKDSR